MAKTKSEKGEKPTKPLSAVELGFIQRTQTARLAKFDAAKDMATALKVSQARYAKWESRTPLPHEYIERFCLIAGVSIEWLFTGLERKRA